MKQFLADLVGYMTQADAVELGLTHHGRYYGIPCWITPDEDFAVSPKWGPFEYLMTLAHYIEAFLQATFLPDDEPGFVFYVGNPIVAEGEVSA